MIKLQLAPNELTPDQRLTEVAAILARGVLRLRKLRLHREISEESAQKSTAGGLDVHAKTVLSGHNG